MGGFKDDNFEGEAVYLCENGTKIEGTWGKPNEKNRGKIYYPNGDRFEGEFREGMKDGEGTYYCQDGRERKGEWNSEEGSKIWIKEVNGKTSRKYLREGKITDEDLCSLF